MLRNIAWLLGYGQTDENEAEKTKSSRVEKPITTQWILNGQGVYVKAGQSTTAAALKSLKKNPEPSLTETAGLSLDATTAFGKELSDDVDPDPFPANPKLDALGKYQEDLLRTATALQSSLNKWKLLKEELIGDDVSLSQYASVKKANVGQGVLIGIAAFFKSLFEIIKRNLEPASCELDELLQETHNDVQVLCRHLNESSKYLKDTSKPEEERRKICVDMCNTSIEINNDLIGMIDNIQAELTHCLKCEKITEQAAKQLILLLIVMVTKIPLPDLDFNFSQSYRNFLYNEIEQEKIVIEQFETDVIGALRRAMNEIKQQEVEWIAAKNKISEQKELAVDQKELTAGGDNLFRLPAQNHVADGVVPDASSETVEFAANRM